MPSKLLSRIYTAFLKGFSFCCRQRYFVVLAASGNKLPLVVISTMKNAVHWSSIDNPFCFWACNARAILSGKCPKPRNDFGEIGCAPAELNINLSSESESGIFGFTAFRQIRFCCISVDCHLAKVSTHILYPKLRHPRLYQAEFSFIYEKFDLYRSFAIPVVWHRCYSAPVQLSPVCSEILYCVCWRLQFCLEKFWIYLNIRIKRNPRQVFVTVISCEDFAGRC